MGKKEKAALVLLFLLRALEQFHIEERHIFLAITLEFDDSCIHKFENGLEYAFDNALLLQKYPRQVLGTTPLLHDNCMESRVAD